MSTQFFVLALCALPVSNLYNAKSTTHFITGSASRYEKKRGIKGIPFFFGTVIVPHFCTTVFHNFLQFFTKYHRLIYFIAIRCKFSQNHIF